MQNTHFSDILRLDAGVGNLQQNVWFYNPTINGRVFSDLNGDHQPNPGEPGITGRRVDLLDSAGTVVQTTRTDGEGRYNFGGFDLGKYQVRAETPAGWQSTPVKAGLIAVTGGFRIDNVNVAQRRTDAPLPMTPPPPRPAGTPTNQPKPARSSFIDGLLGDQTDKDKTPV